MPAGARAGRSLPLRLLGAACTATAAPPRARPQVRPDSLRKVAFATEAVPQKRGKLLVVMLLYFVGEAHWEGEPRAAEEQAMQWVARAPQPAGALAAPPRGKPRRLRRANILFLPPAPPQRPRSRASSSRGCMGSSRLRLRTSSRGCAARPRALRMRALGRRLIPSVSLIDLS